MHLPHDFVGLEAAASRDYNLRLGVIDPRGQLLSRESWNTQRILAPFIPTNHCGEKYLHFRTINGKHLRLVDIQLYTHIYIEPCCTSRQIKIRIWLLTPAPRVMNYEPFAPYLFAIRGARYTYTHLLPCGSVCSDLRNSELFTHFPRHFSTFSGDQYSRFFFLYQKFTFI